MRASGLATATGKGQLWHMPQLLPSSEGDSATRHGFNRRTSDSCGQWLRAKDFYNRESS